MIFLDTPVLARQITEGRGLPTDVADEVAVTGILNVFELVHFYLKRREPKAAEVAYSHLGPRAKELTKDRIFEASRLRVRLHDRGLSYADAAGYVTARDLGALFLTTDRGFQGLPGVRILAR